MGVAGTDRVWWHAVRTVCGLPLTYLWTEEGWLYLTVILDLCSCRIVGWPLGEDLGTELPCGLCGWLWGSV
jgi:transposase InsO family protein